MKPSLFQTNQPLLTLVLISFLTTIFHLSTLAQYDFKSAYFVSNSGDTIYGQIDYNKPSINSKFFFFRADSLGTVKKYLPQEVKSYTYLNSKTYISKTIKISDSTRTRFLEYLVNGVVDLYYINYEGFDYFYISKDGKTFELSNNIVYTQGETGLMKRNSNKYIGVLKFIMQDVPSLDRQINNTHFNSKSLINLVKEYHKRTCSDSQICVVYYKKEKKLNDAKWIFSIGVTLEYGFSKAKIQSRISDAPPSDLGNPTYIIGENNGSAVNNEQYISPGLELIIGRNTGSTLQLGLYYSKVSYANLDRSNLIFPLNWQRDLTRYKKVTPYLEFGLVGNLVLSSEFKDLYVDVKTLEQDLQRPVYNSPKQISVTNPEDGKSFELGFNVGAGVKIKFLKTHEARLSLRYRGFAPHNYSRYYSRVPNTQVNISTLLIGFGVYL